VTTILGKPGVVFVVARGSWFKLGLATGRRATGKMVPYRRGDKPDECKSAPRRIQKPD
jgi:hypothetical protein